MYLYRNNSIEMIPRPLRRALGQVASDLSKEKLLCTTVGTALVGSGWCWLNETNRVKQEKKKKKKETGVKRKRRIAVDAKFLTQLRYIFGIVIPKWKSKESAFILVQTAVLFARSLLSVRTAGLISRGMRAATDRSWTQFYTVIVDFVLTGMTASVINAALKFLKFILAVRVRRRLTRYVHEKYLSDRSYYKLQQDGKLDNVDQRIVRELYEFANKAADLYQRTFKPVLDLVLCTRALAENVGYKGPAVLYFYFVFVAFLLKTVSPPLGKMLSEEKIREGNFSHSHNRLISHAEEVAFLGGGDTEKILMNKQFDHIVNHKRKMLLAEFQQGITVQWFAKYCASCIGYPVLALPFLIAQNPGSALHCLCRCFCLCLYLFLCCLYFDLCL